MIRQRKYAQIGGMRFSGALSSQTTKCSPVSMPSTLEDQINADLLAFIKT
jgi:hypothetical protein